MRRRLSNRLWLLRQQLADELRHGYRTRRALRYLRDALAGRCTRCGGTGEVEGREWCGLAIRLYDCEDCGGSGLRSDRRRPEAGP